MLVYRKPWLVADSIQRLGADVFLRHPTWGYRIWQYYNTRLLDFYLRHRDRCLLIATDALPEKQTKGNPRGNLPDHGPALWNGLALIYR